MRQPIGEVELRNTYRVYRDGRRYIVEADNGRQQFVYHVPRRTVDRFYAMINGQTVTVNDLLAREQLLRHRGLELESYSGGYKLRYELQNLLVILVALGHATLEKHGREFVYTCRPAAARARG